MLIFVKILQKSVIKIQKCGIEILESEYIGVKVAIQSIGIGGLHSIDYEHQRIIRELLALGISPSYDKNTDVAKLEAAKAKLVEKITNKAEQTSESQPKFEDTVVGYFQPDGERVELEESRLGAMTLSELNKIYFGL